MKRISVILIVLVASMGLYAQRTDLTPVLNIDGVLKKNFQSYPAGTPVTVTRVFKLRSEETSLAITINYQQIQMPSGKAKKMLELHPKNMEEFWMKEYINADMLKYYDNKGYHQSIRREMNDESNCYMNSISDSYYKDAYINDYIGTIMNGIVPRNFNSNRYEKPTVKIVQSPEPYADLLSNGTLLISTGLLSTLDSVEELTAVIATNIAHYVMDHQVINVRKQISRARRAAFWGEVIVIAASGVEMALTENSDSYIPGGILLTAGVTSLAMNVSAAERFGLLYNAKQIKLADRIAADFLEFAGMDPAALSSALYKIGNYYSSNRNKATKSTLADLKNRINELKQPRKEFGNQEYNITMSGVITTNAIMELHNRNFAAAQKLVEKNIHNGIANDEDYVVLVKTNMELSNTPENSEKCLALIQKGKAMSTIPNLELYKQEILLLMRLERPEEVDESIRNYVSLLSEFKRNTSNTDDINWATDEISWANRLHNQIKY